MSVILRCASKGSFSPYVVPVPPINRNVLHAERREIPFSHQHFSFASASSPHLFSYTCSILPVKEADCDRVRKTPRVHDSESVARPGETWGDLPEHRVRWPPKNPKSRRSPGAWHADFRARLSRPTVPRCSFVPLVPVLKRRGENAASSGPILLIRWRDVYSLGSGFVPRGAQ